MDSEDGRETVPTPGPARPPWPNRGLAPLAVVGLGLALSALLGWLALGQDRERQRAAVLRDAQALEASLQTGVTRLEGRVRSVTGLMASTRGYDPSVLAAYDSLVASGEAAPWRAVSVGPLLHRRDLPRLEAVVAHRWSSYEALDYPSFQIFPDTSPHPEMMAILGVQPRGSRENVFGYDMMSEPGRRSAILAAAASGLVELSPPVTLSQDDPTQAPSLLLVSVFRRDPAPPAPLVDSVGVVATSFTPSALVEAALDGLGLGRARLEVGLVRDGREILSFDATGAALRSPEDDGTDETDPGVPVRLSARGETHEWRVAGTLRPWDPLSPTVPGAVAAGLVVTAMALLLLLRERGERERLAVELERQKAELQASEARAARYQRSEALGRLTGGIAHDFNNLLTVILGNLDLMATATLDRDQREDLRRKAEGAAERAASLTQSLLTFGRQARLTPRVVEVGVLLAELAPILRTSVPESVALDIELPEEELWIRVDPVQLESALLNLVVNARDACDPGDAIHVGAGAHDAAWKATGTEVEGPAVRISVTDTGRGMSPDVAAQATDPFFTTKPRGRGTGLGLATAAGFLRQSGGDLEIESSEGDGTAVHLWIPRIAPGPENGAGPAPGTDVRLPPGLRVLLVEDEDPVRTVLTRGLEGRGCRVHAVADGRQAVEALAGTGEFDLVLSDLVMPGPVSGLDVVEAARRRPVPVVLMSGYAGEAATGEEVRAADAFLRKPVRIEELVAALGRVASAGPPSS